MIKSLVCFFSTAICILVAGAVNGDWVAAYHGIVGAGIALWLRGMAS